MRRVEKNVVDTGVGFSNLGFISQDRNTGIQVDSVWQADSVKPDLNIVRVYI